MKLPSVDFTYFLTDYPNGMHFGTDLKFSTQFGAQYNPLSDSLSDLWGRLRGIFTHLHNPRHWKHAIARQDEFLGHLMNHYTVHLKTCIITGNDHRHFHLDYNNTMLLNQV